MRHPDAVFDLDQRKRCSIMLDAAQSAFTGKTAFCGAKETGIQG